MQWYRKHMAPWGTSIGYFDEAFPVVRGVTRSICKHYTAGGRFKFYTFVRNVYHNRFRKPADRYVYRSRSLPALMAALRRDTKSV